MILKCSVVVPGSPEGPGITFYIRCFPTQHHQTIYCPFRRGVLHCARPAPAGVSGSFYGFDRATRRHGATVLVAQPLSIATAYGEPPASGYAFWLLGLFVISIGLPFFALAANNPLLQAWFVRTGHPDGRDPYFLYASSNIGSFLALLSYPFLLEPMFTLRIQNLIWSGGFGPLRPFVVRLVAVLVAV